MGNYRGVRKIDETLLNYFKNRFFMSHEEEDRLFKEGKLTYEGCDCVYDCDCDCY